MQSLKNDNKAMSLTVTDGLSVTIVPNSEHEFMMTTKEVANGYGVCEGTIRSHLSRNENEFIESKHFVRIVANFNGASKGATLTTMWTKAGVIRLGFFIKSERAKLFRDWAENLILAVIGAKQKPTMLPTTTKRKMNRLTPERIIRLLALANNIEERELRLSITNEIMGGYDYGC